MRIELERILSLLPKKEDGDFVRGAKKEFAESIGYDSGDIVSMWLNGSSESYLKKLHEISAKYNVSVEWLKGETDDPTPAGQKEKPSAQGGEPIGPNKRALLDLVDDMSEDEMAALLELIKVTKKMRGKEK